MKTKRLVQRALAFLCFTIASCSKNKPCVGSKTREKSPKQAPIKVLTAATPSFTASSTNLSTTTSSQVPIAEGTKLSDNPSSSISTPNTSSSALYSSATKAELATIVQSFPVCHNLGSNDPIAVLNYVLLEDIRPKVADEKPIKVAYAEFYESLYKLAHSAKEQLIKKNPNPEEFKTEAESLVNKAYTYKKFSTDRKRKGKYLGFTSYRTDIADNYYRAVLLQLVILLSNVEKTYEMEQIGGKEDKRTVQKFLAGGFLGAGNFIAKRNVARWCELGITLDGKTIDYWKKKGNTSDLKKLRKK